MSDASAIAAVTPSMIEDCTYSNRLLDCFASPSATRSDVNVFPEPLERK